MKIINLKDCKEDLNRDFEGSSNNLAVIYDNNSYMVKFNKTKQKNDNNSLLTIHRQSALTEYISSKIINSIYNYSQEVELGYDYKKDDYCILCKNFLKNSEDIITIEKRSSRDCTYNVNFVNNWDKYIIPTIFPRIPSQIHDKLKTHYFIQLILDYLIANTDRHVGNWGFIYDRNTGLVRVCPIFDNGSSLGVSIRLNKNTSLEMIDDILTNYPVINGKKIKTDSILNKELPVSFYKTRDILKNKIDLNNCLNIFNEILNVKDIPKERIEICKNIFLYRYNVLFNDKILSENDNPVKDKKLMYCYKFNIDSKNIIQLLKENINDNVWQKEKDKLDNGNNRKYGNTLYNLYVSDDEKYFTIYCYNAKSIDNIKEICLRNIKKK